MAHFSDYYQSRSSDTFVSLIVEVPSSVSVVRLTFSRFYISFIYVQNMLFHVSQTQPTALLLFLGRERGRGSGGGCGGGSAVLNSGDTLTASPDSCFSADSPLSI